MINEGGGQQKVTSFYRGGHQKVTLGDMGGGRGQKSQKRGDVLCERPHTSLSIYSYKIFSSLSHMWGSKLSM